MAKQWGEDGAEHVEITLPFDAPSAPDNAALFLETARGGSFGHYALLIRFELVRDGRVHVRQIRDRVNLLATTPAEFGVTTTAGYLSREQHDALVQDLLLIQAARFRWRRDAPKYSRRSRGALLFYTRTRVHLGSMPLSRELNSDSATEWDAARVWMYADRIKQALEKCEFQPMPLQPRESSILLKELIAERAKRSRWGSAVTIRIRVLGAVGYAPAVDELRRIPERGRIGYRSAQVSLRQIEVLNAPDPKAALLAQLEEPSHPAYPWARALLLSQHRDDYKRFLVARVRKGDRAALATLRRIAEDPAELKARGLTMSDAGKRASAEAAEWELTKSSSALAGLLKIARDKALEDRPRAETIQLLQRIAPGEARVRDALLMMVVDHTDASGVRDQAARTLRHYGSERTIKLLTTVQARNPSAAIAETLRVLKAE